MRWRLAYLLGMLSLGGWAGPTLGQDALDLPTLLAAEVGVPSPVLPPAESEPIDAPAIAWEDDATPGRLTPTAGAAVYFAKPLFENNPAFGLYRVALGPITSINSTRQSDFDWDTKATPLVWLGLVNGEGLGVRARYWRFAGDANDITMTGPAEGDPAMASTLYSAWPLGLGVVSVSAPAFEDRFFFHSDLRINAYFVEATKEFLAGPCLLVASGGLSYTQFSESYIVLHRQAPVALTRGQTDSLTTTDTLVSGHNLNGIGPTSSLEIRRGLGDSGLTLFGGTRGTIYFGHGREYANLATARSDPSGLVVQRTFSDRAAARDDVLPTCEIEAGVEYTVLLRGVRLFVQAAGVSQAWFGAGNAANNETITGTPVADQGANNSSNLGFLGFRVGAGLNY